MHFRRWASLVMLMNKTRVYIADTGFLMDKKVFEKHYANASDERKRKIDSFLFMKDKMLCLTAEMLLKKALSDKGIESYEIAYGTYGKPYLKSKEIHFNLSHSESMVMCAVSDKEIGCDVEKVEDIELEIARRFFFTTEYEAIINASDKKEQQKIFFRLWTLKESFMKAVGLGMKLPLDSFRIDISNKNPAVFQTVNKNSYYFKEYNFNNGYRFAVCGRDENFPTAEFVSFM